MILIPAASAMPVLSDPAAGASTSAIPIVSPFDAVFHATPAQTGDGWYPAAVHRPGPVLGVDLGVPNLTSGPDDLPGRHRARLAAVRSHACALGRARRPARTRGEATRAAAARSDPALRRDSLACATAADRGRSHVWDRIFGAAWKRAAASSVLHARSLIQKGQAPKMTRLFRRRFLKTSLLAFSTSMILIPAASAMPVLSDPADSATQAKPAYVGGPFDGYVTRTADGTIPSTIAKPAIVTGPFDGYVTRTTHGTIPSTIAKPAIVSGPFDGYVTRTADGTIPSPAATPTVDSWYTPAVLGTTSSFSVGRTTPDIPPVSTSAPVLSSPDGFSWPDAGLGLALGAALAAFLAFSAQRARRTRHVPILH